MYYNSMEKDFVQRFKLSSLSRSDQVCLLLDLMDLLGIRDQYMQDTDEARMFCKILDKQLFGQ